MAAQTLNSPPAVDTQNMNLHIEQFLLKKN